jgi:predicted phage terminase large subunit-like protein
MDKVSRGIPGLWTAPSHDIASVGWDFMLALARQIPGADVSLSERRIGFNGGSAIFRSADTESGLRARGYGWLVFDEAAHARNLKDVWEQELRAALSDMKGDALFPSTPKGLNYYHELYNQLDSDWAGLHYPSWTNPFLDPAELDAARRSMPELVFRQEFGAEFVMLAGAIFKREYFKAVTECPAFTRQIRSWDLAATVKETSDRSAGVLVGFGRDANAYIQDVVSGRWEWPALIKLISQTARADGTDVEQVIETTGTQRGLLQLLLAEPTLQHISFRGIESHKDKMVRANPWLARAEKGKIFLKQAEWNRTWLDEICSFPEGDHDDMVDATSGAFAAAGEGWWDMAPESFTRTYTPDERRVLSIVRRGGLARASEKIRSL